MKQLKKGIAKLSGIIRERRRQRALEAKYTTDNYTLYGSILGGYCALLGSDRKHSR